MMRRGSRLLALVASVLFLIASASLPGKARADDVYVVYFPWVSNNETIGGQGPWSSTLAIHNLSNNPCPMSVYVVQTSGWNKTAQLSLNAASTRSIAALSLGVPKPGSPVRLEATCPIAASVKAFAPATSAAPWSDGAGIITGYTGLSEFDIAASRNGPDAGWVLPLVQTNTGWNTLVTIANLGTTRADVTLNLYATGNEDGADGATLSLQQEIAAGGVWTIDAQSALGQTGWVGFARITASGNIGVIARRVKPSAQMAMINVGVATSSFASGAYRSAAPLLFNNYNGWNTGITLANPSAIPATVTVEYHEAGGGYVSNTEVIVPPSSMQYIYTPGSVAQDGFVGGANILSNVPIISSIDEVKYETIEGLSYMANAGGQSEVTIPIVFRENPKYLQHDNSGIAIANLDPAASVTVAIGFLSLYGADLLPTPIQLTIPAGGVGTIYLPFVDGLPAGTVATARLTTASPAGIVAVSNDVNYTVAGDGSVVFNAWGATGSYIAGGAGQ